MKKVIWKIAQVQLNSIGNCGKSQGIPCWFYFHFASQFRAVLSARYVHIHLSLIRNIIKEMNECLTGQMNE